MSDFEVLLENYAKAVKQLALVGQLPWEYHSQVGNSYQEAKAAVQRHHQEVEKKLNDLRQWEKTVRENSPLLLQLEQAEKNAKFDVQAFLEHLHSIQNELYHEGENIKASAIEYVMDELRKWDS